ncbi:SRPBCC domain-containing protein [Streptomyces sp. NPDC059076]|uniref:SRPBCC domain-containing protein n=1 Tax=unclassified Streptomyces TaxID=2593676 RepID=UPI00368F2646
MDHEVFVPAAVETVRQLLRDPARIARCVHGLQQDAAGSTAEPEAGDGVISGRLKVRVANHSITYRGTLRITERGGDFVVEASGTEVRGTGSAATTLTISLSEAEGGTALHFSGSVEAEGRLAELPDDAAHQSAHRLLDRFAERLAGQAPGTTDRQAAQTTGTEDRGSEGPGPVSREDAERLGIVGDEPADAKASNGEASNGEASDAEASDAEAEKGDPKAEDAASESADSADSDAETPTGTSAGAEVEFVDLEGLALEELKDFTAIPEEPPAEAAHARRTMIGRSAEEVDHAPPRGRYAPVPAPDGSASGLPLRWIAPAAALAVASAVVVGRALRRRR